MNAAKRPATLPDLVEAALRQEWAGWPDKLQPLTVAGVRDYVATKHAAGLRAFVKSRPLIKVRGVKEPQPRERLVRDPGPVVGYRDTYIAPGGQVVHEDKITNPKDPAYRKEKAS